MEIESAVCTLCHPEAKQEPAFCSRHVLEILNSPSLIGSIDPVQDALKLIKHRLVFDQLSEDMEEGPPVLPFR